MARPSSGSLYFSDMAAQAQANLRRKSALHESWAEVNSRKSVAPEETPAPDEVEAMKQKYILQNKSLAQQNSAMASRLSDMETKIADLINENMTLKKLRTLNDQDYKKKLEKKLLAIEREVVNRVEDIFQVFRDTRTSEGLPSNPQFDSLSELTRPVTSTPIDDSARDLFGGPIDLLKPSTHKELRDLSFSERRLRSHTPELSPSVSVVMEASEEKTPSNQSDSDRINETILGLDEKSELPVAAKTQILPEKLTETLKFTVFSDQQPQEKRGKQSKKKQKQSTKKVQEETPLEVSVVAESTPEAAEIRQDDVRRSSRVKEKVVYTAPSLRKKMRRESEKFIDAVGGFTPKLTPKIEPETTTPKKRLGRPPKAALAGPENVHSVKRARTSEQVEGGKRKPLSNVNTNKRMSLIEKSRNRKGMDKESSGSIFDFTDVTPSMTSKRYSMI